GKYPSRWRIYPAGANKIGEGEQEHCDDFRYAFDISLRRYADAVNQLSTSKRVFRDEAAVKSHLSRTLGVNPDDWQSVFVCLAQKTKIRDSKVRDWHTPHLRSLPMTYECKYAEFIIGENSLPQVGQHPSSEIIKGC